MLAVLAGGVLPPPTSMGFRFTAKCWRTKRLRVLAGEFPAFLPKEVQNIKDPLARKLATRIVRIPVSFSKGCIMSSCVKPVVQSEENPVVLLHGFDSSLLEWRYTFPMLEEAGLETWAIDILGWGFSDLERLPPCDVASKRDHLYEFWNTYIKRPMTLVGPSLGSAVAIDFSINYPEAVDKLVLIDASVYAEGTGSLATLPKSVAYAGIGRLHCLLPWWEDATVNFMISGGYNVIDQIKAVKQKTLIIWGENDKIIDYKLAVRLHCELPNAIVRQIPNCGHIPHVEKPATVSNLMREFVTANKSCADKKPFAVPSSVQD